jgi:hypothetical protein
MQMRYSLRTLVILMAIGPPILATVWTNRALFQQVFDEPAASPPKRVSSPQSFRRPPRQAAARTTRRTPQRTAETDALAYDELHFLSGACALVLYPLAVLLIGHTFLKSKDWSRPPRWTDSLRAAIVISILAALACLTYFLSDPAQAAYRSVDP